jgi:flagellar basal body-associated protein FliL
MKRIGKIQKIIVILMILIVITIAVCLLNIFIFKKNTTSTKKAEETIKFNYSIYKRDSELFREIFNKLKTTLDSSNIDNNKYAEYITELFCSGFL